MARRILVINTLIASLFVYKMAVLPKIDEKYVKKLNEMVNDFIWEGKRAKIKLSDLQMPKALGGMNLVNFELKDAALKIAWLQILKTDEILEKLAYKALSPVLKEDIWKCNLEAKHVKRIFHNSFWTEVLEAWCKVNQKEVYEDVEILNEYIWYNSKI